MDKTWNGHLFLFTNKVVTIKKIIDRKGEMRERHEKFIKLLIEKEQFIPLHICAGELGVSEKTLRRDMESLNRELERDGAFIERRAGVGIRLNLDGADRAAFFNNMALWEAGKAERQGIVWDRNSRRMDLALNLLLYTDEPASLSDLAYKYYVSRSSITKDLKAVEEFFSRHGLLLVKAKKGTRADGPEQNIRKALTELIVMLLDASGKEAEEPAAESDMMMTILDCFSEDDLICVEKILRRIEERQNYYFDELEYGRVSVGLLVTIYRIREGFSIPPKETGEDGKHRGIYRDLAGEIADGLTEDYGMEISATEQAAMAALLGPNIYCSGSPERRLGKLNAADPKDALRQFICSLDCTVKRVGLEAGDGLHYFWSLNLLKELSEEFRGQLEFCDGTRAIQRARMIKTDWETERIRTAGYVTERAIVDAFREIRAGITTEKEIARSIASKMAAGGVDRISYLTVNSGTDKYSTFNSYATDRVVREGEIVLVDISGHIDGYASDLTRTMFLGKRPPEIYLEMAEIARECVHEGFRALRPGRPVREVSDAVEEYLRNARYGREVLHTSGHAIGLNVTEYPNITGSEEETVQPGMVFAIENGVYPYDREQGASSIWISFRMEDEALATEGEAKWLSGPGHALYTYEDFV